MSRSVPSRSQPYLRSTLPPPTGNLATRDIGTKNHADGAATGAALGYRAERSVWHCLPISRRGYGRINFDSGGTVGEGRAAVLAVRRPLPLTASYRRSPCSCAVVDQAGVPERSGH